MLRITPLSSPGKLTFKLEGKLVSAWVEELRQAGESARDFTGDKQLDLTGLDFADTAGLALLREMSGARGFTVTACSHFLQELLQTVQP